MNGNDTAWYWPVAALAAAAVGVWYGATNVPTAIASIPFVRAVPALLLGSSAAAAVDLVRLAVAPEDYERTFLKVGIATVAILVVHAAAKVAQTLLNPRD